MRKEFYMPVLLGALLATSICARAQTISTVAGNGTEGYAGDGGVATSAELKNPCNVAADASGNIFIADNGNNVVRKVSAAGVITTIAGTGTQGYLGDGGPATAALVSPIGIAVDASDNVYISNGTAVRKISASGTITTVAGSVASGYSGDGGVATAALLGNVTGLAVDGSGNLFICDAGNSVIRRVSASGTITTFAGNGTAGNSGDGGAATAAQINFPTGVAVDASGNVYIADNNSKVVRKVNAAGTISTVAGSGSSGYTGDGGAATSATFSFAQGVAVDAAGNLFIADLNNYVIRKVTTSGMISTYAGNGTNGYGGDGGAANSAACSQIWGISVDGSDNVYIADYQNARIRKVSPGATGTLQTTRLDCDLQLYPNPNDGSFCISGIVSNSDDQCVIINVVDILGRCIYKHSEMVVNGQFNSKIDLPLNVESGVFFLNVISRDKFERMQFTLK